MIYNFLISILIEKKILDLLFSRVVLKNENNRGTSAGIF